MIFTFNQEGNIGHWSYRREHVQAFYGFASRRLEESILESFPGIDSFHLEERPGRDFAALIRLIPLVDTTVVQHRCKNKDVSVVSYSLDPAVSREILEELWRRLDIRPIKNGGLPSSFREETQESLDCVESQNYVMAESIASGSTCSLENAFGVMRYSNFLALYKGASQIEGVRKAAKAFGVKLVL